MKRMTQSQHKRILWVNYVKGVCMVSVILNHLYGPPLYGQLTYPYELVGFFFVAGYTFNPKDSFRAFLLGKLQTLIVPVLLLGLINALLSWGMKGGSLSLRMEGLLIQRPGQWDDLWFVVCLFTMELMFYFIQRMRVSLVGQGLICLVLMAVGRLLIGCLSVMLPWHLENACVFIFFLYMGYVLRQRKWDVRLYAFVQQSKGRFTLLAVFGGYVLFVLSFTNYPIDIHLHQYGNFTVFLLSAFWGLSLIVGSSWLLERGSQFFIQRFLGFVGANSLVYYAFQSKVISLLELAGARIGLTLHSYIGVLACCLVACLLLAAPSYLIKKYAPFLLGRFHLNH